MSTLPSRCCAKTKPCHEQAVFALWMMQVWGSRKEQTNTLCAVHSDTDAQCWDNTPRASAAQHGQAVLMSFSKQKSRKTEEQLLLRARCSRAKGTKAHLQNTLLRWEPGVEGFIPLRTIILYVIMASFNEAKSVTETVKPPSEVVSPMQIEKMSEAAVTYMGTRQTHSNLFRPWRESPKNSFPNRKFSCENSASVCTAQPGFLHTRTMFWYKDIQTMTQTGDSFFFFLVWQQELAYSVSQLQPCSSLFLFKQKTNNTGGTRAPQASTKGHCLLKWQEVRFASLLSGLHLCYKTRKLHAEKGKFIRFPPKLHFQL